MMGKYLISVLLWSLNYATNLNDQDSGGKFSQSTLTDAHPPPENRPTARYSQIIITDCNYIAMFLQIWRLISIRNLG